MNDETNKKLQSAVADCATKAEKADNALAAMQFAQAALNMSNAIIGLTNLSQGGKH